MARKFNARPQWRKFKRHIPGQMNQTEEAYSEILQARKLAGEIADWWFEVVTLKLAEGCRYTPDFAVLHCDGSLELVDTKGGGPIADDALVKIKTAAEKFYQFQFAMERGRKKAGSWTWERREF